TPGPQPPGRISGGRSTGPAPGTARASVEVERVALERREGHVAQDRLVRRLEHHARRAPGLPGLDPAKHVQAPPVAVLEPPEAKLRPGRDEVVAVLDAEGEELVGHLHAHEVRDAVVPVGRAAAVAEVAGERRVAARAKLAAQDVALAAEHLLLAHRARASMMRLSRSRSAGITSKRCGRDSRSASSAGRSGSRPSAWRMVAANLTGSAVSRQTSGTPGSRCS